MQLGDVFITQPAKYTFAGDGQEYTVPLNFCPNCGRDIRIDRIVSRPILVANLKQRIHEYDTIRPRIDELKFISEIMLNYKLDRDNAVKLIQYIRTH